MDETLLQIALSLGLGLLVGLQREWRPSKFAGIRTFTLITVFGTVCALLAESLAPWALPAGLLVVAAIAIQGHYYKVRVDETGTGLTTEIAALLMFGVGALLVALPPAAGVVTGGAAAVLLQWKKPLHNLAGRLGERDMQALSRLVLIGLVILPVLPNRAYDPYGVVNPFNIWLMVVLIVGISMAGYVAQRVLGAKAGTLVGGLLGGLISSTATTVSYARSAKRRPATAGLAATVVFIATSVQMVRMLVEIGLVAPQALASAAPPLLALTAAIIAVAAWLYRIQGKAKGEAMATEADPSDLKTAVVFGLLYGFVLFGVAAAKRHFGESGMFAVAAISGLTDVDAITLSTAQLMKRGEVGPDAGWRVILVGAMANLVFKGAVVTLLGSRRLALRVGLALFVCIAAGAAVLAFWPPTG